jgi:hypothetical protein
MSPIITPFILLFWLRPRAAKLVDFLRNFTVEVVGVGDVCSFSQMDTRRHGNPKWLSKTNTKKLNQARNGKTELSLIHFTHTNAYWKMPSESIAFMDQLRDQAVKDTIYEESQHQIQQEQQQQKPPSLSNSLNENVGEASSLNKSLYHLQSLVYNSTLPSNLLSNFLF